MSQATQDVGQEFLVDHNRRSQRQNPEPFPDGSHGSTTFPTGISRGQSDVSITSTQVYDYGLSLMPGTESRDTSFESQDGGSITAQSGEWSNNDYPSQDSGGMDKDLQQLLLTDLSIESMETLISKAKTRPKGRCHWLPASELDRTCKRRIVLRELMKVFPNNDDAEKYTKYVCGDPKDPETEAKSSRRIFTILASISKIADLPAFVEAGLRDEHLPFIWLEDSSTELYSPSSPYKKKALPCFTQNTTALTQKFYTEQWQVLVPFITQGSNHDVKEYHLHRDTIMPWKTYGKVIESGFSKVRRVEIHNAHHTFSELDVFLKMKPQNHLLELCAAFRFENEESGDIYSFLFPWADGGCLRDLWCKKPTDMLQSVTPSQFLLWIAEQCHGLVMALNSMHDLRQEALKKANLMDAKREEKDEYYGIHGDIKPENILHFSQLDSPTGLGVLKLADFGLTDFHTLRSRTMKAHQVNMPMPAPTYKAPELVVPGEYFSRKTDIWALGCVFSQFMTWAIRGVGSVKKFDDERKDERDVNEHKGESKFAQDTFFKAEHFPEGKVKTTLKTSTKEASVFPIFLTKTWLDNLHQTVRGEEGKNFLVDFLKLIQRDMLKVERDRRIGSEDLVMTLAELVPKELDQRHNPYWNPQLPSFSRYLTTESVLPRCPSGILSNGKRAADDSIGGRPKRKQLPDRTVSFDLKVSPPAK
ncbi:kinase-like domain-containing protein [Ilyonectria destructans]|nr:kinase-like domain-containing protein [Ilyonectria destructans]